MMHLSNLSRVIPNHLAIAETSQQRLNSLQALRGIAALMVVAFHLNVYTLPENLGLNPTWPGLNMGYAGVEIFFVLSGFIMFYRHGTELGQPKKLVPYLYARFARIFPVFWMVLVMVMTLRFIVYDTLPTAQSILISASMLPIFDQHILGIQWTLSFELMFYIIFGLAFFNVRLGLVLMMIWFGVCIALIFMGQTGELPIFFFSPYNILFLLGIIAATTWQNVNDIAVPLLLTGIALFIGVGLSEALGFVDYNFAIRTVFYGVGAMAMICAAVSLESQGRPRVPTTMVFLGNASYAIYLVHITARGAVSLVFKKIVLTDLPTNALALLVFVSAVCVGAATHILLEKPTIRFLRRWRPESGQ